MGAALLLSLAAGWARWIRGRGGRAVAALLPRKDGSLAVALADGSLADVRVLRGSTVLPLMCILLLQGKAQRRTYAVVLLPDSLAAEELRALRVWLRWRADRPA